MDKKTSSLLQLPRQLRDRIWSYAYADLVVHAEPACVDQKVKPSGNYGFRYVLCQEVEPPLDSSKWPECCPNESKRSSDDKRTPFFWPIVSRKFWAETIEIFYASAVFVVGGSIDLYILASSQQICVRRMRNLVVRLGFGIKHHNRIWSPARCSDLIKRFERLRGLTLLIGFVVEDNSNYTGTMIRYDRPNGVEQVIRAARMEGLIWDDEKNNFPGFLRSFQQHGLQTGLTHVAIFDRSTKRRFGDDVQKARVVELQVSMKAVLLNQSLSQIFPNRVAEDKRELEDVEREQRENESRRPPV
ncbi:hypothetical protein EKO04_009236 [Ascochyta lentis]|uniref:Uncharacterized protein n=1 Tax=Ascochyta lentis TaxID=205686 RepID=A0A8H7IU55_9PLEO|nr:hypothetical protein EKO04_009236 [Ascochyta lentis]